MHAIELNNISFSYGRRRILENLSFTVAPGECAVLAGPNGSGKSTALSLMAGVLRPDSGCIYIQGVTGFAPQGTALFEDMTAEENLRFFAKLKKCPFPETLPFSVKKHLNTRVSRLSGGTKKQVSIACALLGEPDIILLDEPCESLDVGFREELCGMVSSLKAQGRTIVYVGHEPMEFAPFYDKLIFFGKNRAEYSREELSGSPADDLCLCDRFAKLFKNKDI